MSKMSSINSFNFNNNRSVSVSGTIDPVDDIYDGFQSNSHELLDYENVQHDEAFQSALRVSSYGKRMTTPRYEVNGGRLGTAVGGGRMLRSGELPTGRPTTAVQPVGYTSEAGRTFDPLLYQRANSKKTVVVEIAKKPADMTEEKYRALEAKIQMLLEESILDSTTMPVPELSSALNKAKEASSLDRTLLRLRDQHNSSSYHNFDLTFSVMFNLANIYAKNRMHVEALNTYSQMTKNKMFANVNRLKINMGNIYFELGLFPKAIKMFQMALDQVPINQKELRLKIRHNIGIVFIKMGQYSDAAASFDAIMSERADLKCGLHLILCYYALGDTDKIKRAFQLLLEVQFVLEEDHRSSSITNPAHQYILDACKKDDMAMFEAQRKSLAEKNILMSANLISAVIEENFNDGYTWCVEVIKNSSYPTLANELELNKAIMYLKQRDVAQAIETLKYYEKKEPAIAANAVCNLSFIYLQQRDLPAALKYAQIGREMDSYNPAAFVNSGACELMRDDLERAKVYFETALEIDAMCFEALYNLGLVCKKMGHFELALGYFRKIHLIVVHIHHPHVVYQMANVYELMGDTSGSLEWYVQMLGTVSMDPGIFQKIAEMSEAEGDRQQAFQYQNESYRAYPTNLQSIEWLGSHYIDLQVAEKAIDYYEKAVLANPNDPYFLLRIAGCFRRIGNTQKSLHMFQNILRQFPENVDCYRALIHLTQTLNMDEMHQRYLSEFQRLEKLKETRQRIGSSRPTTTTVSGAGVGGTMASRKRLSGRSSQMSLSSESNRSSDRGDNRVEHPGQSYADPLGPPPERPRTGKIHSSFKEESDDDLDADEMLPM